MIPDTVLGLLVVAASLGPGYLFVRIGELRSPRPSRSTLLELTELVATGGTCTIVVLWLALPFARWTGEVDLNALATDRTSYVLRHPFPVLTLVIGVLAGSYVLAAAASWFVHRGYPATQRPYAVWHEALRIQDGERRRAFATVELRDGRVVAGPVAFYTTQSAPSDERELALERPIRARPDMSADYEDVPDDRILLRASDIVALSVKYF